VVSDVEARVRAIAVKHLSVKEEDVTLDARFEDLGADSLDATEFVMALEEEFSIEIGDEEAEKISTLRDAVDTVRRLSSR
jgi:acyl carrier protein